MNIMKKALFIDRDGTLIKEPADEQIDAFEKLEFVPGVMRNLAFIRQKLDYEFVMVSNQDGLGTGCLPRRYLLAGAQSDDAYLGGRGRDVR